ncbi:MAG TPA: (2Fe-2S)-binding protein [Cellvibrio sp.]|nr:(2Fe-2S)-binding protein [Cellvibrio sp.]
MLSLNVNGNPVTVDVAPDVTLLWVLREHLGLTGTKYGCGVAMCGACTVHINGVASFACQLRAEDVSEVEITTIEGLSKNGTHPLQVAWIEEQAPQCGYCQSGQIMRAAALLADNPHPSKDEIISGMSSNICRCGSYPRIVRAIQRASGEI